MRKNPALPLLLILTGIAMLLPPIHIVAGATTWSGPTLVDHLSSAVGDLNPSAVQTSNGTLWVAFQSDRDQPGRFDIFYKTMNYGNGTWSDTARLTSLNQNQDPAIVQMANGTIIIFWSGKPAGHSNVYYKRYNLILVGGKYTPTWSSTQQLTTTPLNDTYPSATVGRDGSLWLVWTRINATCSTCGVTRQLFYRTLAGGSWTPEYQLTSDNMWNWGSSITTTRDGIVRLVWSKTSPGTTLDRIFYSTNNGAGWSAQTDLTQLGGATTQDDQPSIIQDRNGTLWVFWGRQVTGSTTLNYALYEMYSYNLGSSWPSGEVCLATCSAGNTDSKMPSAVQSTGPDKSIWLMYITNPSGDFDIYALTSNALTPVHNVLVTSVNTSGVPGCGTPVMPCWFMGGLASIGEGNNVTIAVTVLNPGDYRENITVSLTISNSTNYNLSPQTGSVASGSSLTLFYQWNTSGVKPARYRMTVTIPALPGETAGNLPGNTLSVNNSIHILPLADIDEDGWVSIQDVSIVFYEYGFSAVTGCNANGCFRYSPLADIENTGTINIQDASIAAFNYGIVS